MGQQAELAALEPELTQVAESLTDDQSLDELAVPVELMVQVEAENEQQFEQIQSELTIVTESSKETQHPGALVSERREPEFIEIDPDQNSREVQPVTTQLAQVAAVSITQQSHIESISDTEAVARIDEESVDQSQPAAPALKTVVTEVAAPTDLYSESQILPESVNNTELAAYVGELFGPEPTLLETEAKQVAESLIDNQRLDEQLPPAETQLDPHTEVDLAQQNHIEPNIDTELVEAAESETNRRGPWRTDYRLRAGASGRSTT